MKKQLILAALACSLGAAQAQPSEVGQPKQPTKEQQEKWHQRWEEEQREELRHPSTMIHAFVSALGVNNFACAA